MNDLQDLWRAEARQLPLKVESVDPADLAREVSQRLEPAASDRHVTIEVAVPVEPAGVQADRDRLSQILTNYLTNALRYSPERSTVTVAVRPGPSVVLSVRDHDPGLTDDQRAHMFERFYRVDPSRSRALGGSGIGLAIARALAEAMNGRGWVHSEGPGTGSTFSVSLPAT